MWKSKSEMGQSPTETLKYLDSLVAFHQQLATDAGQLLKTSIRILK